MSDVIKNASFKEKTKVKIPKNITKKDVSVNVREIENGFIIEKNYEIEYTEKGGSRYKYFTKTWFVEDNPLEISVDEPKELSDNF